MTENINLPYGLEVLIGVWDEKRAKDAMAKQKFVETYKKGRSRGQIARTLRENMEKKVSIDGDTRSIRLGSTAQIMCPRVQSATRKPTKMILTAAIPVDANDDVIYFHDGFPVLATSNLEPTVRNVWTFRDARGGTGSDAALELGQPFTIALAASGPTALYLRSLTQGMNTFRTFPIGYPVTLSSKLDRFCIFKISDSMSPTKAPPEGAPVVPSEPLFIYQVASNLMLCVEEKMPVATVLDKGLAVTIRSRCHSSRPNNHNIWALKTNPPRRNELTKPKQKKEKNKTFC